MKISSIFVTFLENMNFKIQEPFHYAIACMNEAKAKLKVKTKEDIINMYERYEIRSFK